MTQGLAIVTYLWSDENWKHSFCPDDVRLLQRMVSRHLPEPHKFVCVTDQPEAFLSDDEIHAVPIRQRTHVLGTCFARLFTFPPEAKSVLGDRVLQLDLDTIIVGDLTSIVNRKEDLVLWRNPRKWALTFPEVGYAKDLSWYNGSVMLHRCGTRCDIWEDFDPMCPASRDDQWLLSDRYGRDHPYFDGIDGVYRLAPVNRRHLGVFGELPENARIVTFPGDSGKGYLTGDPGENAWIAEHRC